MTMRNPLRLLTLGLLFVLSGIALDAESPECVNACSQQASQCLSSCQSDFNSCKSHADGEFKMCERVARWNLETCLWYSIDPDWCFQAYFIEYEMCYTNQSWQMEWCNWGLATCRESCYSAEAACVAACPPELASSLRIRQEEGPVAHCEIGGSQSRACARGC